MREPQTKLFRSSDTNKLLIVTYASDGNAYPGDLNLKISVSEQSSEYLKIKIKINKIVGNEFWGNYLTGSGDPAAACSTQISELHNPRINVRTSGASLHVASPEHGVVHIGDYAKLHLT